MLRNKNNKNIHLGKRTFAQRGDDFQQMGQYPQEQQQQQQMQANDQGDVVAQLVHLNVTLAENMNMLLKMNLQPEKVPGPGGGGYDRSGQQPGMMIMNMQQQDQQQQQQYGQGVQNLPPQNQNEHYQFGFGGASQGHVSQNVVLEAIDGDLDQVISQAQRKSKITDKKKTLNEREKQILQKRQEVGKPKFKLLSDHQLLTILDPSIIQKLQGLNNRQKAQYFMKRDDFGGVMLDPKKDVIGKIYRSYGIEPQIQEVPEFQGYSGTQIEFIKKYLKLNPNPQMGLYQLVKLINQTKQFVDGKKLTAYYLKKIIQENESLQQIGTKTEIQQNIEKDSKVEENDQDKQ